MMDGSGSVPLINGSGSVTLLTGIAKRGGNGPIENLVNSVEGNCPFLETTEVIGGGGMCPLEGGGEATDDGGPRREIRGTGTPTMREDGGEYQIPGIIRKMQGTTLAYYIPCRGLYCYLYV
jgi:hypothetical protein